MYDLVEHDWVVINFGCYNKRQKDLRRFQKYLVIIIYLSLNWTNVTLEDFDYTPSPLLLWLILLHRNIE